MLIELAGTSPALAEVVYFIAHCHWSVVDWISNDRTIEGELIASTLQWSLAATSRTWVGRKCLREEYLEQSQEVMMHLPLKSMPTNQPTAVLLFQQFIIHSSSKHLLNIIHATKGKITAMLKLRLPIFKVRAWSQTDHSANQQASCLHPRASSVRSDLQLSEEISVCNAVQLALDICGVLFLAPPWTLKRTVTRISQSGYLLDLQLQPEAPILIQLSKVRIDLYLDGRPAGQCCTTTAFAKVPKRCRSPRRENAHSLIVFSRRCWKGGLHADWAIPEAPSGSLGSSAAVMLVLGEPNYHAGWKRTSVGFCVTPLV